MNRGLDGGSTVDDIGGIRSVSVGLGWVGYGYMIRMTLLIILLSGGITRYARIRKTATATATIRRGVMYSPTIVFRRVCFQRIQYKAFSN
jgi:hypothetical protein